MHETVFLANGVLSSVCNPELMTYTIVNITETQQASEYIVLANELYIHQLSLDGSRTQTLVSGLGFAKAVDYDIRSVHAWRLTTVNVILPDSGMTVCITNIFTLSRGGFLFWTDTIGRSIMRSNLDGTDIATVLDQNLIQPGSFSQC